MCYELSGRKFVVVEKQQNYNVQLATFIGSKHVLLKKATKMQQIIILTFQCPALKARIGVFANRTRHAAKSRKPQTPVPSLKGSNDK